MSKNINGDIIGGSGFTQWTVYNNQGEKISSEDVDLEVKSFTVGDCLNLYEKLVLDSSWSIIDSDYGSTFILARKHMFYTPNNSLIKKIDTITLKDDPLDREKIKRVYEKKDELNLLNDSATLLAGLDLLNDDVGVLSEYLKSSDVKNKDDSVYDILAGDSTKKVSVNHFAVSKHNLIFHEIAVENNTPNTIKYMYENILNIDQEDLVSILPLLSDNGLTKYKIIEKTVTPIVDQQDKDARIFSPTSWFGNKNKVRSIEFLSNQLLNEIRWCYQGKIFIKYNPEIKSGDTITLLDDVTSTYGKFEIDSFEHIFDSRGMITICNVKACIDLVDPALDVYARKIALELSADIQKSFENKEQTRIEEISIKNLLSYYNKISLQQYLYGKIHHMEEHNYFDDSGIYPEVDDSILAPALAVRFIPFSKKGKIQVPESLKGAFFYGEKDPFISFGERLKFYASDFVYHSIKNIKGWGSSVLRYAADFLISIPTLNLHEFIKLDIGMTQNKVVENSIDESNVNDEMIDTLIKDTDYTSWASGDNYHITFGFFNVMAQRQTNLMPGINNDNINLSYDEFKQRADKKAEVIRKIIESKFDICGCVEMYDSFKSESGNDKYEINNFIDNCKPKGFVELREHLFSNHFGSEMGVLYFKNNMFSNEKSTKIMISQNTYPFAETSGDTTRNYVETTVDVSNLGYLNEDGQQVDKIYFIWFHNIFGSSDLKIDSRESNIKDLISKYGKLAEDNPNIGVVIMGDHNLEVVNPNSKPKGQHNKRLFLGSFQSYGFINYMRLPTTLTKDGSVTGSIYENVLLSPSLVNNKLYIDVSRFMYPYSNKSLISDHVPVFVGLKKRS